MLLRSWKMSLIKGQEQALLDFAETVTLPLLRAQEGCLGAYFSLSQQECLSISIWHDQAAITAMEQSSGYQELLRQFLCQGVIADSLRVEVWQVYAGHQQTSLPIKLAELSQQALLVKELN